MKHTKTALLASLDAFTRAYLVCALWSSTDNATPSGGDPLDANYEIEDFTREALIRAISDCAQFQAGNASDLASVAEVCDTDRAGHNFWLNRNGHGSGFWDEVSNGHDLEVTFDRLSDACKVWGECNADAYRGKVHLC